MFNHILIFIQCFLLESDHPQKYKIQASSSGYEIHGSRKSRGESRKEMVQVAERREETATLEWN